VKITLKQLRRLGACINQVELFKATFGAKVEITEAVCKEHGSKFDTDWLAAKLFSPELLNEYEAKCAPFLKEYQVKCAPLYAEYQAKCAPLYAEYQAKRDQFYAEYRAKYAPLDAEYEAKYAPLDAEYQVKHALVFMGCLEKMEGK